MGFFQDLIDSILYEIGNMWAGLFSALGETAFYIEEGLNGVITDAVVNDLSAFVAAFALSLVILKVLKKGFWTYILWSEGDPDASVQQTVVQIILAVAIALSFPTLYKWFADICLWLIAKLSFATFGVMTNDLGVPDMASVITSLVATGAITGIVAIIYFIMLFVLYLHFIKRSAELLVLRIGFPLACLGLLDSDKGVFSTTVKTFLQVALTTVTQLFFMMCSVTVFVQSHSLVGLFYCIAFCMAAFAIPRTLQFILMQTGGGGLMQKASSTLHTVSLVKGLLKP